MNWPDAGALKRLSARMAEQSGHGPERLRLGRKQHVLRAKEGANT